MQISHVSRVETCFAKIKEKRVKSVCTFYANKNNGEMKVFTFFRFQFNSNGNTFYLQASVLNARLMERRGFPDER